MAKNEKHKRAVLIWISIYPLITLLLFVSADGLRGWPLPLRTLLLTIIAVPVVVYVLLPFYSRLFKNWLNK
jgi:hypothetical protein